MTVMFKNKILHASVVWLLGVFIFTLVLSAHAGDEEHGSLFIPASSGNYAPDDAATDAEISDSQQEVVINLTSLKSRSEAYGKVRFDFLGHSVMVQRTQFLSGLKNSVTWFGKPEEQDGSVVLSVCGSVVFGLIELGSEAYKIEPVRGAGTHRIFKLDPKKAATIDDGGIIPHAEELPEEAGAIPAVPENKDDGTVFDVLVLYTKGFAEAYPDDELTAQINYLINIANVSYSNSEINLTARVAGLKKVDYKDGGDLTDALYDLTNGDGVFSGVGSLRNKVGADLVVLLRVFTESNIVCGRAWQMASLSSSFGKRAFSVVQVGRINYGSGYMYCVDQTLAHEMGHNMGCAHDAENGSGGVFKYSYGYCFSPYKSVMAYCTSAETTVSHFSNPDVTYAGLATGAEDANNARSITNVKETIAQFRDSKCLGSITASSGKVSLNKEETAEITVTVADEYGDPAEGETVKAEINSTGKKVISVSPSSDTTDSSGQITFSITAGNKKGAARLTFKSDCLKKSITVKVR